ncbi:phytanoyl-CoA dioxygenase family protein [Acidovorax sp. LjRoot66]|uniref:phytanoyl-CoA dioxygenase family protein n=1 Tax=Acidovorax sp. LjRoot66 TaxID=3342334 RepID=UPI003ECF8D11
MFEKDAYEANGFAVTGSAFSAKALGVMGAELRRVLDLTSDMKESELQADFVFEKDLSDAGRNGVGAANVGDAVFIAGNLARYSSLFGDLFNDSSIGAARHALGTDELVAHLINATIKHPGWGRRISWHRDFPNQYLSAKTSRQLRIMVCLDGMKEEGGATRFVPGSHLITDEAAIAEQASAIRPSLDERSGVCAECAPGSLVLIHPKVLHASPVNTLDRARRNIVMQIGVAGEELRGTHEYVTGARLAWNSLS